MKRVKYFLVASLTVVAIAGAIATKAKTFNVTEYYYDDAQACQSISLTSTTCVTGDVGCTSTIAGASRQLYKASNCTNPLKN